MSITLSLILPAYNEASRLPTYLHAIQAYFSSACPVSYEVIVIDDGSEDGLQSIVLSQARDWPQIRFLRLASNLGKGAAIRAGILAAAGELVLFADADGATPVEEESKLRLALLSGADMAVGSRLLSNGVVQCDRAWMRELLGRVFAEIAGRAFCLGVRDTQCGFKMFHREVALHLLEFCHEDGYLFDVELLAWGQRLGYRIVEVPVSWKDIPGSKVRLLRDGSRMLFGLFRLMHSLKSGSAELSF